MKTVDGIPTGKLRRAGKILKTSLKVGANYVGYYGEKLISDKADRDALDKSNATEIMDSLKELKGGGLKLAQMLSMEEHLIPQAYVEQFSLAQFSVPPLSAPLVKKSILSSFGKSPEALFDRFNYKSRFAASIGQVHEAWKDNVRLAVKIQYPGVADSIRSDLALLRPLASTLLRVNSKDTERYFREIESRLLEETDYELELKNSIELTEASRHITDIILPEFYSELSNKRVITMRWIEGEHLTDWLRKERPQELRNKLGQDLWDFFLYQFHILQKVHADPHPGNILVSPEGRLAIIDFGCIKSIPDSFYHPYARLTDEKLLRDRDLFEGLMKELEILSDKDSPEEYEYFSSLFHSILSLLLKPVHQKIFDFSDDGFFSEIGKMAERLSKETLRSSYRTHRGSEHFLYTNRVFFGLYNLLHMLEAKIEVRIPKR